MDDSQKIGALLVGLEVIANLMGRCTIYETLYLGDGTRSAIKFGEAVVELYARILLYLVRAKQYYSKNTAGMYRVYSLLEFSRLRTLLQNSSS